MYSFCNYPISYKFSSYQVIISFCRIRSLKKRAITRQKKVKKQSFIVNSYKNIAFLEVKISRLIEKTTALWIMIKTVEI